MKKTISFEVIPNSENLHRDFVMEISSPKKTLRFDTYHFWNGEFETDTYKNLVEKISMYLNHCKNTILHSHKEPIYIPLDFSDEYYGSFKVSFINNQYKLEYGVVRSNPNVRLEENNNLIKFDIGDRDNFDPQFIITMNEEDVVNSFCLMNQSS